MAYRRSLSTRVALFTNRLHPSLGCVVSSDDKRQSPCSGSPQPIYASFLHQSFHSNNHSNSLSGYATLFQERGLTAIYGHSPKSGLSVCNYSSSSVGKGSESFEKTASQIPGVNEVASDGADSYFPDVDSTIVEGSGSVDFMADTAQVLSDTSVGVAVSQVYGVSSEVAIAAADSYAPVAALQYIIDNVHSFTGLNWWASIALTTVIIRTCTFPLMINQLKATSKLSLCRPHLEKIKKELDQRGDPAAYEDGKRRMQAVFKEYGVTPFSPLMGVFIQGPIFISFFFAISNMAEKVPSFKEGGAFWFTDLTTPDPLLILPVLTALTFWLTVELNMQQGMEGNPTLVTMKKVSRIFAVLTVPLTVGFPKALFCYWISANLFSLVYGQVIKSPRVKEILGLPEMPVEPTTTESESPSLIFSKASLLPPEPLSKDGIPFSSSSVSERIKTLESQVRERSKTE